MIDRWWCETPPIRHIHLRAGDGRWRLIAEHGDTDPWSHDFTTEADARAAAEVLMLWSRGHWQRQPASRSAAPRPD